MIINLIISIVGLYCLGLGVSLLLQKNKKHSLTQHFETILIGIIFLITTASVLDVAKISLNTPMLAKTSLLGLEFIFFLSAIPIIYWFLSFIKKKQKINFTEIIPLVLFILIFAFVYSQPTNQIPSPTIISLSWKSATTTTLEISEVATRYIDSFHSLLNGTESGGLLNVPMTGLLFVIIFILGLKIVKSNLKPGFSIKDPLLGSIVLSLALIYPTKAIYVLVTWAFLAIINLFLGNKNQAYLVFRSILIALIINPLIWGMLI
jgi:hypothetical protein